MESSLARSAANASSARRRSASLCTAEASDATKTEAGTVSSLLIRFPAASSNGWVLRPALSTVVQGNDRRS